MLVKTYGFKKRFRFYGVLGFNAYAQSHVVHWTQEYDQEEGLYIGVDLGNPGVRPPIIELGAKVSFCPPNNPGENF